MENIYNANPIKLIFNSYIGDGLSFENTIFPPFIEVHVPTDESWAGKIYADDNARPGFRVIDVF